MAWRTISECLQAALIEALEIEEPGSGAATKALRPGPRSERGVPLRSGISGKAPGTLLPPASYRGRIIKEGEETAPFLRIVATNRERPTVFRRPQHERPRSAVGLSLFVVGGLDHQALTLGGPT